MKNFRNFTTYLMQALIHKTRTPLATIQNDIEYANSVSSSLNTECIKEVYDSIKKSINKINTILDDTFYIVNNKEHEISTFCLNELLALEEVTIKNEVLDTDISAITLTLNKNDFLNYFKLLYNALNDLNLLDTSNEKLNFILTKENNDYILSSSFRIIEYEEFKTQEEFSFLSEYINVKNCIDSINSVLSDIILSDLGLSIHLKTNKNLITFSIKGF